MKRIIGVAGVCVAPGDTAAAAAMALEWHGFSVKALAIQLPSQLIFQHYGNVERERTVTYPTHVRKNSSWLFQAPLSMPSSS